jgi:hypothetical protein
MFILHLCISYLYLHIQSYSSDNITSRLNSMAFAPKSLQCLKEQQNDMRIYTSSVLCRSTVIWSSHESTSDGVRGNPEGTDKPMIVVAANVIRALPWIPP